MGFFKNVNANIDFEALEQYIKNNEWEINNSSNSNLFSGYCSYVRVWNTSFNAVFDVTWSFKSVNGTYMIDSSILYEGSTYREVRTLKDIGVLFQAMIDEKPIRVAAGVKYVDNRHIAIRFVFDINNGDRKIIVYEVQRKIKKCSFKAAEATYNSNYSFEHDYMRQQQKLAKRYSSRNNW